MGEWSKTVEMDITNFRESNRHSSSTEEKFKFGIYSCENSSINYK